MSVKEIRARAGASKALRAEAAEAEAAFEAGLCGVERDPSRWAAVRARRESARAALASDAFDPYEAIEILLAELGG